MKNTLDEINTRLVTRAENSNEHEDTAIETIQNEK